MPIRISPMLRMHARHWTEFLPESGEMSAMQIKAPKLAVVGAALLCVTAANAQSCLILSSPTIDASGSALFDLSLFSAPTKAPAAVQWTFQYDATVVNKLVVDDGPSLTFAGKTTMCYGNAEAYNCLAVGRNTRTIGNGVVARLTAQVNSGATAIPISIRSAMGASPDGYFLPVIPSVLSNPRGVVPPVCKPQSPARGPISK